MIADIDRMDRMAAFSREQLTAYVRGISLRQVRLVTGIVLFAYLISHFLNHALGNISMEALAGGLYFHTWFWQFLPVAILFYTACLVHSALGIWALYERRQFRWKAIEPLQLVLGLSIPMLVIAHIIGVRLGQTLYGHEKLYPQVLFLYWVSAPYRIWLMLAVITIAWVHGCIGLYLWLRMKAFFKRAAPFLLAAAVLIPTLAMLGFYQGGRKVIDERMGSPAGYVNIFRNIPLTLIIIMMSQVIANQLGLRLAVREAGRESAGLPGLAELPARRARASSSTPPPSSARRSGPASTPFRPARPRRRGRSA